MSHRYGLTGGLVAVCVAVGVWPFAAQTPQQPQPPVVFRGGADVVYVDAYPRRDGRIVEGLRAEDFQVFEDGKPQRVTAFEFIRSEPYAIDDERRDPNTKEDGDRLAADPHNRVFVFYLDSLHTTLFGGQRASVPLRDFIRRTLGPNDLFGVATPERPSPADQIVLGRSTETLTNELLTHYDWGFADQPLLPRTPLEEQLFTTCLDGPAMVQRLREAMRLKNLEDLIVHLGTLRDERKNVLLISENVAPRSAPRSGSPSSRGEIPRIGVDPRGGRMGIDIPQAGTGNEAWCNRLMAQSAGGAKSIRDLIVVANRANVTFHLIDLKGLSVAGGVGLPPLGTLAQNTGGVVFVNNNDVSAGFRRIADDLSAYYLLGYAPTNAVFDGKYRSIQVKIAQPKISVTARPGYLAANVSPQAFAAALPPPPPSPVTEELGRLGRLRADAELFGYGVKMPGRLDVVVELASAQMERAVWRTGAEVTVTRAGAAPVTARIDAGARAVLVHVPVSDDGHGPWPISLRVSAGDATVDGRVEISAGTSGEWLGDPVVFRGTASANIPLRPVADFQFRRAERLHVEWPVLKPLDRRLARLLDRRGQPLALSVAATETTRAGEPVVAVDLTVAALAEGDYLIELEAGAGGKIERRLIGFRVVR